MKPEYAKRCNDCPLKSLDGRGRTCAGPLTVSLRPFLADATERGKAEPVDKEERHRLCAVGLHDPLQVADRLQQFVNAQTVRLGRAYHDRRPRPELTDVIKVTAMVVGPMTVKTHAVYYCDTGQLPRDVERVRYTPYAGKPVDVSLSRTPLGIDYSKPH